MGEDHTQNTCLRCAADTHEPRTTRHVERDLSGRSKQKIPRLYLATPRAPVELMELRSKCEGKKLPPAPLRITPQTWGRRSIEYMHPAAINMSSHAPPLCGSRRTSAADPHTP